MGSGLIKVEPNSPSLLFCSFSSSPSPTLLRQQECDKVGAEFPNFNFNVSHHGDYVAIASEPLCLVGLDIVSFIIPGRETVPQFVQNFSSYFSILEWNKIINAGTDDEILAEFYSYWCLKEAYVKAIGRGVADRLDKVEFHHTGWTNICVKIDGETMTQWRFWLFELGKRHWVSIAKGHPRSATDNYKRTLAKVDFNEEDYNKGLCLPNTPFVIQTVEQLVSLLRKAKGILDAT
ncbi:L-aminoadipate-semialdehyde dehydrogenase-phosphopantetheinyl transferase-like isoform X2 [Mangifera indica]|uniref:L-aminoadipate-semialdehyde dehydrogenase-phosphopantetheinyl transferase-like isoform X2 n=1 Tax=Mangifera indica TaxID=29780 RepID=UPI001CFABE22|nr:L-aminoadipate-semialdehyde dehydrogenase-phosphopantetheinyl transferase-like isoform X2 [Mangifera indica]